MSSSRPHSIRRTLALASAVLAVAAVAAGCGSGSSGGGSNASSGSGGSGGSGQTQNVNLVLPAPNGLWAIGLIVAEDRYLKQEGLNVKPVATDGSSVVLQQLISGNGQYGIASAASLMIAASKGSDLVSVADMTHDDIAKLVVPQSSPIKSIQQLKGKQIGIPSLADGSVPIVEAMLKSVGMTPNKDVHFVVVGAGGPAVAASLQNGRIAAYAGGASDMPGIVVGGHMPVRSIVPPQYDGLPGDMLVVSKKTLSTPQGRDTAIKIGRAWIKGAKFATQNQAQTVQIGCKLVPDGCKPRQVGVFAVKSATQEGPTTLGGSGQPGSTDVAKAQLLAKALGLAGKFNASQVFSNAYVADMNKGATP